MIKRKAMIGVALVAAVVAGLLVAAAVPQRVTTEDVAALTQFGIVLPAERDIPRTRSEQGQADFLRAVERRVHARVTAIDPVANGHPREPADVLAGGTGVCFDRARVIEQAVRLAGFEARRDFLLYMPTESPSAIDVARRFATPGGPTHTVVEVKVGSHWVFMGTLTPVIGIDSSGRSWSARALSRLDSEPRKRLLGREGWKEILDTRFVPIEGLYSRHGQHYWPYPRFPNYAPGQVIAAWTDPTDDQPGPVLTSAMPRSGGPGNSAP
jgi:hypothetical protein